MFSLLQVHRLGLTPLLSKPSKGPKPYYRSSGTSFSILVIPLLSHLKLGCCYFGNGKGIFIITFTKHRSGWNSIGNKFVEPLSQGLAEGSSLVLVNHRDICTLLTWLGF